MMSVMVPMVPMVSDGVCWFYGVCGAYRVYGVHYSVHGASSVCGAYGSMVPYGFYGAHGVSNAYCPL